MPPRSPSEHAKHARKKNKQTKKENKGGNKISLLQKIAGCPKENLPILTDTIMSMHSDNAEALKALVLRLDNAGLDDEAQLAQQKLRLIEAEQYPLPPSSVPRGFYDDTDPHDQIKKPLEKSSTATTNAWRNASDHKPAFLLKEVTLPKLPEGNPPPQKTWDILVDSGGVYINYDPSY